MQRLYTSFDTVFLGHLYNLMMSEGVKAEIRNQYAVSGFGELPATEATPELWVDDLKFAYANELLQEALKGHINNPGESWICPKCHEKIDGQFSQCWKCLSELDSS